MTPTPHNAALRQRIQARADGYRDALMQYASRRLAQHPDYRFAYDAGYRDGEQAHALAVAGKALDRALAPDPNPRWREG